MSNALRAQSNRSPDEAQQKSGTKLQVNASPYCASLDTGYGVSTDRPSPVPS
jgi:hypothetical protein